MKKILTFILIVLAAHVTYGQYPITSSPLGNSKTLVPVPGGIQGSFINRMYADTTTANTFPNFVKFYPGAIIATITPDAMWKRNATATKWVRFLMFGDDSLFILPPLFIRDSTDGRAYLGIDITPATTPTWQSVMSAGSTYTGQTALIQNIFGEYRVQTTTGGDQSAAILRVYDGIPGGLLLLVNSAGNVAQLNTGSISTNRLISLPDNSGTLPVSVNSNGSSTAGDVKISQSGSFLTTGTATTAFTVTITTRPNTVYKVLIMPTTVLTAAPYYISAKTTSSFTITFLSGLTGTVAFDWVVLYQ